jgi:hypothetical protein
MASAKIYCFETTSNSVMQDRKFMSSAEPSISVMVFSLAAMTTRVHSTKRGPSKPYSRFVQQEYLDDPRIDRGLRIHEALKVERITNAATPSTIVGPGLSAVPDSP